MPLMNKLFYSLTFLLTSTLLHAACEPMITLESDDSIYPGRGEVQLCTNSANQISKLVVVKPVKDPYKKNLDSDQADERNPILHISIDQINSTQSDIPILTPSRMGITVKAAVLTAPKQKIDKDKGGEVVLKVIKSKLAGSYHHIRLKLEKNGNNWEPYVLEGDIKTPVSHFFFKSGTAGIKKVEYH